MTLTRSFVSKPVFTVYVGLAASGYDVTDVQVDPEIGELVRAIRRVHWPDGVLAYFSQARSNKCASNPYWPNAYLITLASLHISESDNRRFHDPDLLRRHVSTLDGICPDDRDARTVEWVLDLPNAYAAVSSNPAFEELWGMYQGCIDLSRCNSTVQDAVDVTAGMIGIDKNRLPDLGMIPNPLQNPEITDIVTLGERVFVIMATPDMSSCIHELLHHVLTPILHSSRELVEDSSYLLRSVAEEMLKYRYAWDESAESWFRVFEEHFVRAAEIWISNPNDAAAAQCAAARQAEFGFRYVPAIVYQFRTEWLGLSSAAEFIAGCLKACRSGADADRF